jgi:hypothetical protein
MEATAKSLGSVFLEPVLGEPTVEREFRHATNLRIPFEPVDLELLAVLPDYRIGAPVAATCETALSDAELRELGIVGLYTTAEALSSPFVAKRTGWERPEKVLGRVWPQD